MHPGSLANVESPLFADLKGSADQLAIMISQKATKGSLDFF